jgi:TATA-box binding protein (TBP) (component of TFIID and TFIIIB)
MNFDDITISTQTIIGVSNTTLDIESIYRSMPIDERILTIYYQNQYRGCDHKKRKKKTPVKYFRNALNIVIRITDKIINFKVSKNGKFQITGCRSYDHAIQVVRYFFDYVPTEFICHVPPIEVVFYTVMTNIDFNVGFCINRQKLDTIINESTNINSLLETSFGYTGVNIKFPIEQEIDVSIPRLRYHPDKTVEIDNIQYKYSQKKKKYNTFLVFHSGNIIMSGPNPLYMKSDYNTFVSLLRMWRTDIEESNPV